MKSSLPEPTKAEAQRIDEFRWIGCVVSHVFLRIPGVPYDVHHLVEGNQRLGHAFTIPLNPWHHRGIVEMGRTALDMRERYGPSKARNPREFSDRFGSDRELLEATNALLEAFRKARAA